MNYQRHDNCQWAGSERHKHAAAEKPFPPCTYLGCSHKRLNMMGVGGRLFVYVLLCLNTLELLFPFFLGCGCSSVSIPSVLTRFLKSAVTSLVNTAKFRKPVETSLLSWVRWLFPKFSRTSMYCSLFSTWAENKPHTGKMSIQRQLKVTLNEKHR